MIHTCVYVCIYGRKDRLTDKCAQCSGNFAYSSLIDTSVSGCDIYQWRRRSLGVVAAVGSIRYLAPPHCTPITLLYYTALSWHCVCICVSFLHQYYYTALCIYSDTVSVDVYVCRVVAGWSGTRNVTAKQRNSRIKLLRRRTVVCKLLRDNYRTAKRWSSCFCLERGGDYRDV